MNRGDVVIVDWPYSDLSGSKLRPAVVVQADLLNGLVDDTVYVKVQSQRYGIPGTEVELDPATETMSGLKHLCYASCKDLLTREQALVHHPPARSPRRAPAQRPRLRGQAARAGAVGDARPGGLPATRGCVPRGARRSLVWP